MKTLILLSVCLHNLFFTKKNGKKRLIFCLFNLNISRYVSTTKTEKHIDLQEVNEKLVEIEKKASEALNQHNEFLKKLELKTI